ncbi:MAG TPA: hypothetical protein VFS37_06000 [Conexibacter sp.]|nr:hypothetical protein [Conexibacter sp.]
MPKPDGGPVHVRLGARPSTLTVAEVAWVALIPCAAIALLGIALLGPPLGDLLFTHTSDALWPPTWWEATGRAEPAKQGRFLLAVLAPSLLVSAIVAGARHRPSLSKRVTQALVLASYSLVVALVAVALIEQASSFTGEEELVQEPTPPVFAAWKVATAAALALATAGLLHRRVRVPRIAQLARETRSMRWIASALAAAFIAIWVLKAVTTDRLALGVVSLNLPWTLNDAVAVLDGRTPLVDYHPVYAKLLPYVCAPVLAAFGTSALTYSALMALLSGLALLAVFAVFRRVTGHALLALALLVPFVATGDYTVPIRQGVDAGLGTSPMMLPSLWPMRYGGAYLLAWLAARHVDGDWPRRSWILFLVGGLIAVDTLEFGAAATVAVVAALLCAHPPSSPRDLLPLARNVAGGLAGAVAVVALATLAHSGSLPDFGLLLEWPRIFTTLGWFSMPLRTWGLHVAVYATYVAAIAVAAVRLVRRDERVLLTSMLAWSGVFGLLAGGYFIGRPDAQKLTGILSAWSFALSMLTIVCVRSLAANRRRPSVPQLLTLFGFALSLCSLTSIAWPNEQLSRLRNAPPGSDYLVTAERFIGERTRPREKVVVLLPMGFAITHDLGLRNVSPYGFMNAVVAQSQMTRLLQTLNRERVATVFVPAPRSYLLGEGDSAQEQLQVLESIGFRREQPMEGIVELRRS